MSIAAKPVGVVVLEELKMGRETMWAESKMAADNTEAVIRHVSTDIYVLEIKERAASNVLWKFDFTKIKSYKMKTKTWHQLRYLGENEKVALRFKDDDRNFPAFFEHLQRILMMHKKFKKPKNSEEFLKEVKMFKLEKLTPVAKSKRGRFGRLFNERTRPMRPSGDSGISADDDGVSSSFTDLSQESFRNRHSSDQLPRRLPRNATGNGSPTSTGNNSREMRWLSLSVSAQLPPETSETSEDEGSSERSSGTHDDPIYSACDSYTDSSSIVEFTCNRQRPETETSPRVNRSPVEDQRSCRPPPMKKCSDYVNINELNKNTSQENAERLNNNRTPDERQQIQQDNSEGTSNDLRKTSLPPPPPKKRLNNLKTGNVPVTRTQSRPVRMDQNLNNGSPPEGQGTGPLRRQHSLQEPIYGSAPTWRCEKCSLVNRSSFITCEVCLWTRTDAWECRNCSRAYSTDLSHCQSCPTWRCRLCTFVNTEAGLTECAACLQK